MAAAVLCSNAPNAIPVTPVSAMNTTEPASSGQLPPLAMSRPAARAAATTSSPTARAQHAPRRLTPSPVTILAAPPKVIVLTTFHLDEYVFGAPLHVRVARVSREWSPRGAGR